MRTSKGKQESVPAGTDETENALAKAIRGR
jgi:hypothetical protein